MAETDISIEDYWEQLFQQSEEQLAIKQSKRLDSTIDTAISSYSGIYNPTGSYKKFDYVYSREEGKFFYAKRDIDNGPGFNFSGANRFFLDPNGPFDNEFGQTHYIFDEANLVSTDNQPIKAGQKIKLEGSLEGADGFYEILDYKTNVSSSESTTNKEVILARLGGTIVSEHAAGSFWFTSPWFLKTAGSQGDEAFFYNPSAGNSFIYSTKVGWIYLSLENEAEQYQDPHEIAELFKQHVLSLAPETVKIKVTEHHGGYASRTDLNFHGLKAAAAAFEDIYQTKVLFSMEGGSIPIVADFKRVLDAESILMGFGVTSDAIHSPNESFHVKDFYRGIKTSARFFQLLAEDATS